MVHAYPLGGDAQQIAAARDLQTAVGVEDLWILEQMDDPSIPLDVRAEVHTKADLGCLEYRRMLAELGGVGVSDAVDDVRRDDRRSDATAPTPRPQPARRSSCTATSRARSGPTTVAELARTNGVALPVDDPTELYRFANLAEFLEVYAIICASLHTADDFRRITYEALEDAAAAGVRYREMFFSPGFLLPYGVAPRHDLGGHPRRSGRRPRRPRHPLPDDPRRRQGRTTARRRRARRVRRQRRTATS